MTQIASIDWLAKRFYLHVDTVINGFDAWLAFAEVRAVVQLNTGGAQNFKLFLQRRGKANKGSGSFTPKYVSFLPSWRAVPYGAVPHGLEILTEMVSDDLLVDKDMFDRTSIAVNVDIDSIYDQVEIITADAGAFTDDDRILLQNIHGQVERTVWFDSTADQDGEKGYQQDAFKIINSLVDYTQANRINKVKTLSDMTLEKHFRNVRLEGIGMPTFNAAGFNLKGMEFWHLQLDGTNDGLNPFIVQQCELLNGTGLFGYVENSTFKGNCHLTGHTHIVDGKSGIEGAGFIWIDVDGFGIQTTNWHRSLGISNMTSGVHTIEMYGGQLHLDAECEGGVIYLRGNYSVKPENLGTTVIIDQTEKANLLSTEVFP